MSNSPRYEVINKYIFFKIQSGDWNTGLPSIGELAIRFKVSKAYIQKIYRRYVKNGLLMSIPHKGFFINDANTSFNEIMDIKVSNQSYKEIETIMPNKKILDEAKRQRDLEFFYSYKHVSDNVDGIIYNVYFNYDIDFIYDDPTPLLKHFILNNIIIKKEIKFHYNSDVILMYECEEGKIQIIVQMEYPEDDVSYIDERMIF